MTYTQYIKWLIVALAGLAGANIGSASFGADQAGDPRIRSLDYCADQYTLAIAHPDQITALSVEATMRHSYYREQAVGIPQRAVSAENILLDPADVILRSWEGGQGLLAILDRADRRVVSVSSDPSFTAMKTIFQTLGAALDRSSQVDAIIQRKQDLMGALKAQAPLGRSVLYITSGGYMAGEGTDIDLVLKLAGASNAAAEYGAVGWQPIALEALIMNPPSAFVAGFFDTRDPAWFNWSLVRHPSVGKLMENIPTVQVPGALLSCGALFRGEAADYIRTALQDQEGASE